MAINTATEPSFSGNVTASSSEYPYGSGKTESAPGLLDGTPRSLEYFNNLEGFLQSILIAGSVTPSGSPDDVLAPQYLESLVNGEYYNQINYRVGVKARSGATYFICLQANGPASTLQDPTTDTNNNYWVAEEAYYFERTHRIGTIYTSAVDESPQDIYGAYVGTWARAAEGKALFGVDSVDTDFDTPLENGGGKSLTVAQLPTITIINQVNTGNNFERNGGNTAVDSVTTQSVGSADTVLPPYETYYIWRRTA